MENTDQTTSNYWQKVRAGLSGKVATGDFVFIRALNLPEKLMLAAIAVLKYADSLVDIGSVLPNLSAYMVSQGFEPWCISSLRNKGLILLNASLFINPAALFKFSSPVSSSTISRLKFE